MPSPVISIIDGRVVADDSQAHPLAGLLSSSKIGPHVFDVPKDARLLFTDNETNAPRVFGSQATSHSRYTKDAFHRFIVDGETDAVNPENRGTKMCA